MLRTWQHSPGRLQPKAPDHRHRLSPVSITGLSSVVSKSHSMTLQSISMLMELECAYAGWSVQA